MTAEAKAVVAACLVAALSLWLAIAMLQELNTTRVIMIRADRDLAPGDVSAIIEEAKRITGESSL
jgi:hypothetical protein